MIFSRRESHVRPLGGVRSFLRRLWRDEAGAETAEWVVIVAFLVLVGVAIYNGILRQQLIEAIETVGDNIAAASSDTST